MKNKGSNNNLDRDKPIVRALASLIPALFLFYIAFNISNSMFGEYLNLSDREKTAATITELILKNRYDDPTEQYVEAKYSYFFQGIEYQEDSVSLSKKLDPSGTYWPNLYSKLQQDKANNNVIAWVNPDQPNDAILDKTIRLEFLELAPILAFILLFGGAGLVFLWLGIRPKKPANEGIECEHKNPMIWILLLFGIFFFMLGLFACITKLPTYWATEKIFFIIIPLLFMLIGGGMIAMVVIARNNLRILGPGLLYLDSPPRMIGGQVGGKFKLNASKVSPITITLSCKSRGESDEIIWQQSMPANVQQHKKEISVRFAFDCPTDLPSSGANLNSIAWIVRAKGEISTKNKIKKLDRSWVIPVKKVKL